MDHDEIEVVLASSEKPEISKAIHSAEVLNPGRYSEMVENPLTNTPVAYTPSVNDKIEEYKPAQPNIDIGMGIASFNTDLYLSDDIDQLYENVSQCALPVTMQQSLTDNSSE